MVKRKCPINPKHELSEGIRTDIFIGLPEEERLRLKQIRRLKREAMYLCFECNKYFLFLNHTYVFDEDLGKWIKTSELEKIVFT